MDQQPVQIVSATEAAERLGVSASGLRRLGAIYAQVHGELPREQRTEKRIWTGEVVERLAQARALVEMERFRSIKEALEALDKGLDLNLATDLATDLQASPTPETLGVLIEEIRRLHNRLEVAERAERKLEEVGERLANLERQLEAPKDYGNREAELEEQHRLNQYLHGELERRRLEAERTPTRRPWWRLWRR